MHGSSEVVGPTFMMRLQPFDRRRMTGFAVGLSLCGGEKASVLLSLSPLSEIGRFVVAPHRRLPHRTPDRHLRAFPRKRSPSAPILRACVPLPRTLVPRLRPVGGLPAPEFSLRGTAAGASHVLGARRRDEGRKVSESGKEGESFSERWSPRGREKRSGEVPPPLSREKVCYSELSRNLHKWWLFFVQTQDVVFKGRHIRRLPVVSIKV